jgi:hypothetical protein
MTYDVVVPLGPNDEDIVKLCIDSIRKYVRDVKNIYVISHRAIDISGVVVVTEEIFPFTKDDIKQYAGDKKASWYLQQLLKLYAQTVITSLHDNVLIVDADTIFNRSITFMHGNKFLFNVNNNIHNPYFKHMGLLHPSFTAYKRGISGIVNTMIVNRGIIKEIFKIVEEYHSEAFWRVFMKAVDNSEPSSASEYEIYFHYIMKNHPGRANIRMLYFDNSGKRDNIVKGGMYHYINYHGWNQGK